MLNNFKMNVDLMDIREIWVFKAFILPFSVRFLWGVLNWNERVDDNIRWLLTNGRLKLRLLKGTWTCLIYPLRLNVFHTLLIDAYPVLLHVSVTEQCTEVTCLMTFNLLIEYKVRSSRKPRHGRNDWNTGFITIPLTDKNPG